MLDLILDPGATLVLYMIHADTSQQIGATAYWYEQSINSVVIFQLVVDSIESI
jgi:hypothetical protein